jgi:hypothetical protein
MPRTVEDHEAQPAPGISLPPCPWAEHGGVIAGIEHPKIDGGIVERSLVERRLTHPEVHQHDVGHHALQQSPRIGRLESLAHVLHDDEPRGHSDGGKQRAGTKLREQPATGASRAALTSLDHFRFR